MDQEKIIRWESIIDGSTLDWLLEKDNPSVRYYTMLDLLNMSKDDAEVKKARSEIMKNGMVPCILHNLRNGSQNIYKNFYTEKYNGLVWQLILLAEHGATLTTEIEGYCNYIIANSQEKTWGGFSMYCSTKNGGGQMGGVVPCLTGNMVWCMLRLGYINDESISKAITWITDYTSFNDGTLEKSIVPHNNREACWGKHTCFMGVVKILKALGEIPVDKRTYSIEKKIAEAVDFMLIHNIYKCSNSLEKISKPSWLKLKHPLMYQTDILEILDILTSLNIKDHRMDDAMGIILSKQNINGRWIIENENLNGKMMLPLERQKEESKWLTLKALRVIKKYYADVF